jgi:galactokinase
VPQPSSPNSGRARRLVAELEAIERQSGAPRAESAGPARVARAPGRVNLIGEHTDYNEGFALPAAIDLEIWMAFRPWAEPTVEVTSPTMGETRRFDLEGLAPERATGTWVDYLAGVAWAARREGLRVQGFRGVLDSTLPSGAGLSSSAALELLALEALLEPGARPESIVRARLGRARVNEYRGVATGLLDQLAIAAGRAGHAILVDCRSLALEPVRLPDGCTIVACHTGSARSLRGSEYGARRADCETGVRLIAESEPDVTALRDVDEAMLERHRERLPERVYRRCLHVVREDARVLVTVEALRAGDLDTVGRTFAASHESLRDLFEIVSPELDAMVEIARTVPGVVAARMTGGGFGGCTVNLVEDGAVDALATAVVERYPAMTGLTPHVYPTSAVDGAGLAPS